MSEENQKVAFKTLLIISGIFLFLIIATLINMYLPEEKENVEEEKISFDYSDYNYDKIIYSSEFIAANKNLLITLNRDQFLVNYGTIMSELSKMQDVKSKRVELLTRLFIANLALVKDAYDNNSSLETFRKSWTSQAQRINLLTEEEVDIELDEVIDMYFSH